MYVCIYICTYIHIYVCVIMYMYGAVCICYCVNMCASAHVFVCVCVCVCVCMHVHVWNKTKIYKYYFFSYSSTGNASQPIWLDNVECSTSTLDCIGNCASCPFVEDHNCGHFEDITVECGMSLHIVILHAHDVCSSW